MDNPNNCFPSIHVSISFLAALAAFRYQKKYWLMITWAVIIAFSTMLVKQHYFLDVVSGITLAIIVYLLVIKKKNNFEEGNY